jgi:glycosyltransferase involved in cell wall biosynthesis
MFGGTRSKIACIFHSTALPKGELRLLPLFRWALRKADMFICVSASQLAHWSEAGLTCKRTVVVRNGIDLQKFVPDGVQRARVRSAYGFADGDLVLGLVATFRPEKNHEALVQAVADLRKDGVPAKAILVGDGPTRQTVEDYAAALRVKQHVVFAGEQADVKSFIAASDVGILCSRTETLPLAALEFTAMGVPMVMSRLGGTAEIVSDGENGLLFDLDQPHDLAKQLTKLTSKEVRMQMGSRAREAAQQFSFERMVESYIALAMELHGSG